MIVENGQGLEFADSYATEAEADKYLEAHGNAAWVNGDSDKKVAALVRATAALDGMYSARWPGMRAHRAQGLDWPRMSAFDVDGHYITGVPVEVRRACMIAAAVEYSEPGALTEALARGGRVSSETIGPMTTSYEAGAPAGTVYPAIKNALARIIGPQGHPIRRG